MKTSTLHGTNISHVGKRNIIFPTAQLHGICDRSQEGIFVNDEQWKSPGWLGYTDNYTNQLSGDYFKNIFFHANDPVFKQPVYISWKVSGVFSLLKRGPQAPTVSWENQEKSRLTGTVPDGDAECRVSPFLLRVLSSTLGGGFKYFSFSFLFGEMIQFD